MKKNNHTPPISRHRKKAKGGRIYSYTELYQGIIDYCLSENKQPHPDVLQKLEVFEKRGIFRILEKWQKQGVDIEYIVRCLLYNRLQSLIKPEIDEMIKSLKQIIKSTEKLLKKIRETGLALKTPLLPDDLMKTEIENISKKIISLKKVYKLLKSSCLSITAISGDRPAIPVVDVTRNMAIVLAYNHLAETAGTYAYGKEKAVPLKFQKDLLFLFRDSDPEHFPRGLTLNTLAQRIFYVNKNYPKLVEFSKKKLLKFDLPANS